MLELLDLPERVVEEIMLHRSQIEMVDADDPPKKILEALNHHILEYQFLKMIKKMLLVFFMQKIC